MGTNYYVSAECPNPCEHCAPELPHIGKSSAGWRFLADADDMGTRSWAELRERIESSVVVDEYGKRVDDLVESIESKADLLPHDGTGYASWMTPREESSDGPVDFTEGGFT